MKNIQLNNEVIVFDLEATSNQETSTERPALQTNNYIIEIGAVFLDRELNLVDQFQTLVRPEELITPFITEITAITPRMCENEPLWKEVGPKFSTWVSSRCKGSIKSARLAAWGNYFDIPLLRNCYSKYDLVFPFSGTCIDVKTLAMIWMALSGRRTDKLSVETVAATMNIPSTGGYHRALVDAIAEAMILKRVFSDLRNGFFIPNEKPYPYLKMEL